MEKRATRKNRRPIAASLDHLAYFESSMQYLGDYKRAPILFRIEPRRNLRSSRFVESYFPIVRQLREGAKVSSLCS
jgi:hypothetical protein